MAKPRIQLCSRSGTGNRPYEARIIHGPFTLIGINGFVFEVVTVKAIHEAPLTRSVIETRTGWRLGHIPRCRTKAEAEAYIKTLWNRRQLEHGCNDCVDRIAGKPTLTVMEV